MPIGWVNAFFIHCPSIKIIRQSLPVSAREAINLYCHTIGLCPASCFLTLVWRCLDYPIEYHTGLLYQLLHAKRTWEAVFTSSLIASMGGLSLWPATCLPGWESSFRVHLSWMWGVSSNVRGQVQGHSSQWVSLDFGVTYIMSGFAALTLGPQFPSFGKAWGMVETVLPLRPSSPVDSVVPRGVYGRGRWPVEALESFNSRVTHRPRGFGEDHSYSWWWCFIFEKLPLVCS